ncbi:hypothetical protein AVEN_166518-1 [Araneus ventricosus]|uniref:MADF domain-containing protein n=1 Tax=Araneus ventricosus TaxID=182803 RepID=A0A4Y2ITX4_ARAVE|nr:hypothetical protein AVEN_166518-1 [Araneus ventricosus]
MLFLVGKRGKMRLVIDTNLLIKEVEHRPVIWDVKLADYSNKLARRRCWEELTEIFSPAKVSEKEKKALNELLQKKWKNIRDRFARDVKYGGGKKSQYMYSPKLQFLQNSFRIRRYARSIDDFVPMARKAPSTSAEVLDVSERESKPSPEKRTRTDNNLVASTSKNTPSTSSDILDVPEEESKPPPEKRTRTDNSLVASTSRNTPSTSSDILDVPEEESKPPPEKRTRTDNGLVETKLIEFLERNMTELQDTTKNSQDEDRLFLLSLLTNLKSIQPHFRLKAKIEILTVLDKYPKIYEESDIVTQPRILEVMHSVDP